MDVITATPRPREKITLEIIPNEIIQHLLQFISPEDNLLCFQRLSKHLNRLANSPLLWREHCRSSFKYWNPDHEFQRKLGEPVADVDWKRLFIVRKERNSRIAQLFDGILARRSYRLSRFEQICLLGYDGKDFLLEQCATDENAANVLARRYYGRLLLDSVHRSIAIEEWRYMTAQVQNREGNRDSNVMIERSLAAYGMFVLHNQYGDIDEVSLRLDDLAAEFQDNESGLALMSTRQKALVLNQWLRSKNLTGMEDPAAHYRRMRNCFIGQALFHEPHESLPLISSAIYCSMAERIGLDAQSCVFPGHVHVAVFPPPGQTLDGLHIPLDDDEKRQALYLDPFGKDSEVSEGFLRGILNNFGWQVDMAVFLAPARAWSLTMRMAHNIAASIQSNMIDDPSDNSGEPYASPVDPTHPVSGASAVNRASVAYSLLWVRVMLLRPGSHDWKEEVKQLLNVICNEGDGKWKCDLWLVRKYLYPAFEAVGPILLRLREGNPGSPQSVVDNTKHADRTEPFVMRRNAFNGVRNTYRIGQVVRHMRLLWVAIITGWGPHVDERIAKEVGYGQPFYSCIRAGSLERLHRVPEDSLVSVDDRAQIPEELYEVAGWFFDRLDDGERATCRFVPSKPLRLEFPDG